MLGRLAIIIYIQGRAVATLIIQRLGESFPNWPQPHKQKKRILYISLKLGYFTSELSPHS